LEALNDDALNEELGETSYLDEMNEKLPDAADNPLPSTSVTESDQHQHAEEEKPQKLAA
jgi:hypothetical protein